VRPILTAGRLLRRQYPRKSITESLYFSDNRSQTGVSHFDITVGREENGLQFQTPVRQAAGVEVGDRKQDLHEKVERVNFGEGAVLPSRQQLPEMDCIVARILCNEEEVRLCRERIDARCEVERGGRLVRAGGFDRRIGGADEGKEGPAGSNLLGVSTKENFRAVLPVPEA
jgi:hypothetical protein